MSINLWARTIAEPLAEFRLSFGGVRKEIKMSSADGWSQLCDVVLQEWQVRLATLPDP